MLIDDYEDNLKSMFALRFLVTMPEYAVYLLRANFKEENISYISSGNKKETAARLQQSSTIEATIDKIVELHERGIPSEIYGRNEKLQVYDIVAKHFELLPKIVLEDMWGMDFKSEDHNKLARFGDDLFHKSIYMYYNQQAQRDLAKAKEDIRKQLMPRPRTDNQMPMFKRKLELEKKIEDNITFDINRKPFKDVIRELEIEVRKRHTGFM